jgi:hypothetical protein
MSPLPCCGGAHAVGPGFLLPGPALPNESDPIRKAGLATAIIRWDHWAHAASSWLPGPETPEVAPGPPAQVDVTQVASRAVPSPNRGVQRRGPLRRDHNTWSTDLGYATFGTVAVRGG